MGDPDIMDTWATSSLTPQIAAEWEEDPDLFSRVFPMDLRPAGPRDHPDLAVLHRPAVASGVRDLAVDRRGDQRVRPDPERKKMSKSKGNVVTPIAHLEQHGADAVRYWAASARLGIDAAFDERQIKIGRRLAIKILNASAVRPAARGRGGPDRRPARPFDARGARRRRGPGDGRARGLRARPRPRDRRALLLGFTDDYLELVKGRAYGGNGPEAAGSAIASLRFALEVLLRLFAPFLPYAHRGGVVVVEAGLDPPRELALDRGVPGRRRAGRLRGGRVGARRGPQG